jgi:hypothetical protein
MADVEDGAVRLLNLMQVSDVALQLLPVLLLGDAIHANRRVLADAVEGKRATAAGRQVAQQEERRCEPGRQRLSGRAVHTAVPPPGQYTAHEAAFKESGGIEYAADLAITLTRPTANESAEACSTLRVELARDCDDDPRGELAAYRPRFPFYGLEEIEPEKRQLKSRIRAVPRAGGGAEPLSFMDPKRP